MRYLLRVYGWSLLFSFLVVSIVWQFAEVKINTMLNDLYFRISGSTLGHNQCMDEKGIPIQYRRDGKSHYNPLFIARYAQEHFSQNNPESRECFIRTSGWLVNNAVITDSNYVNYYSFDLQEYRIKAPWASALAQAVIMNVMRNRYESTGDSLYLDYAQKAMKSLIPGNTNLSFFLNEKSIWFNEYPAKEPPYVLNGMISVLFELDDYHQAIGDTLSLWLFDRGYEAVVDLLPRFDDDGFSFYDLRGMLAGRLYHQKHIAQLQRLNQIRPHPIFPYYEARFKKADRIPVFVQMLINPKIKRILSYLLAIILLSDLILLIWVFGQRR